MKLTLAFLKNSKDALDKLDELGKSPRKAHLINMWIDAQINPHFTVINEENVRLLTLYGKPEGQGFRIDDAMPKYKTWLKKWSDYLDTEVDVKPLGLTQDELVSALSINGQNDINGAFLRGIEPFTKGYIKPKAKKDTK